MNFYLRGIMPLCSATMAENAKFEMFIHSRIYFFSEGDSSWLIKLPKNRDKDIDRVICVEVEGAELEFEPIKR